jgi:hypothetical protein
MRRGPGSYQYRVKFDRRGPARAMLSPGCFISGLGFIPDWRPGSLPHFDEATRPCGFGRPYLLHWNFNMRGFWFGAVTLAVGVCACIGIAQTATNAPAKKAPAKSAAAKNAVKLGPKTASGGTRASVASRSSSGGRKKATTGTRASAGKPGARKPVGQRASWRNRQTIPTTERYQQIQTALAQKGYLRQDQATGQWTQDSVEALRRFQTDQSLEPSGKINALSLIALGLGPKLDASVPPKPAAPAQPPQVPPTPATPPSDHPVQ